MSPPTNNLFAAGARMVHEEAVDLTLASLRAYWDRHSHIAIAWSGGKDSTATLTLLVHLIETGELNVEEFTTWGPLTEDDQPDPARKGETFAQWIGELRRLGYRVEHKELRACDYGAPTIRKRLFLIARRDGREHKAFPQ
jgi:hypothetical protein